MKMLWYRGSRRQWAQVALIAVCCAALLALWVHRINGAAITDDSSQTLQMAINLQRHGIMSASTEPPLLHGMRREPVPVIATALTLSIVDGQLGQADRHDYLQGERARLVKLQNIFWMALLCAATFWAVIVFTDSRLLGAVAVALLQLDLPFIGSDLGTHWLNSLYSELPAAALMVSASALLAGSFARGSTLRVALAGLCLGLLALTKAATLYIFIGLAAVLLLAIVIGNMRQAGRPLRARLSLAGSRAAIRDVGIMTAVFFALVLPWMYRNYVHIGEFAIAERGGIVLLIRAIKNRMTPEEYRGTFYAWAPYELRPVIGALTGFSPRDLQRGGRLQRLNRDSSSDFARDDLAALNAGSPQRAISYYRKAGAEQERVIAQKIATGIPRHRARTIADGIIKQRAIDMIRSEPGSHLALIAPVLWRGAFVVLPLLVIAAVYALWVRRYQVLLFALPSFGSVMFYAAFTHFIPRYSIPMLPVAIVCGLVLVHAFGKAVWARSLPGGVAPKHSPAAS